MYTIFRTDDERIHELNEIVPDSWIHMVQPTAEEIREVAGALQMEEDFLWAALDEEERSRLEVENGQVMILVDTPIVETDGNTYVYSTLPLAVILTKDNIVTVTLKDIQLLKYFYDLHIMRFSTKKRNRFILQILYRNATMYLSYLRQIDKASNRVQGELHQTMKNKELLQMLQLEKSLVYISTSLKGNEIVMEKLLRMSFIKAYPDDEDLLEDVIIENKQAIEMSQIYTDILASMMDAYSSIISNNLNAVMKLLTTITLVMTIPTIIASLWGMNVFVPFQTNPYGFAIVMGIIVLCSLLCAVIMWRKKMF